MSFEIPVDEIEPQSVLYISDIYLYNGENV